MVLALLCLPLYMPQMIKFLCNFRPEDNIIKRREKKGGLPPDYAVCLSESKSVLNLKKISKKLKCTINDLLTLAISMAYSQLEETGHTSYSLMIPANMRIDNYQSESEVKLENKFTVVPMKIPLCNPTEKIETNVRKIKESTFLLKQQMALGYCFYF